MSSRPVPSAALVVANKQLHKLRAQIQVRLVNEDQYAVNKELDSDNFAILELPEHLGWHSTPVSQVIRSKKREQVLLSELSPTDCLEKRNNCEQKNSETAPGEVLSVDLSQSVKVYPDIALAMLRQKQSAAGRLWLLLRHLDEEGRGVLRVVNLRKTLTTTKTKHRLCGWRQLRNLLKQGEGIYWHRDKERVWLRSAGKVAANLGVERLNGHPVAISVKYLLGSIGEARAYLYASFHAGRQPLNESRSGQKPIARDTLSALTGLTAECQRSYERRVGVRVSQNYVVGKANNDIQKEERLWRQGRAAFEFVDFRGGQGKPGKDYIAWQLPNSYSVALAHRPKGRQKRINRVLNDLFMQGMTGNRQQSIEKRYFGDGAAAVRAICKRNRMADEVFWLQRQRGRKNGRFHLWHTLSVCSVCDV